MRNEIEIYAIEQVRRIRLEKGISQSLLSFGIGVSKGFVGQVESPNGSSKYNLKHLNDIAKFLGCNLTALLPERPL